MNNPFEVIDARLRNIENMLLDIKHPQRVAAQLSTAADVKNSAGSSQRAVKIQGGKK